LSHILHWYGLTPECERLCRANSSDRENRQPQPGHVHANGFSPVCRRRWAFRCELLLYILLQPGYVQKCTFSSALSADWRPAARRHASEYGGDDSGEVPLLSPFSTCLPPDMAAAVTTLFACLSSVVTASRRWTAPLMCSRRCNAIVASVALTTDATHCGGAV